MQQAMTALQGMDTGSVQVRTCKQILLKVQYIFPITQNFRNFLLSLPKIVNVPMVF